MKKALKAVFLAVVLLLTAGVASAQLTTAQTIAVTVLVQQQSTISLSESGGNLTIDPTAGTSNQVTFSGHYNLGPASSLTLYTYFSSASAALSTTGGSVVASSSLSSTFSVSTNNGSFSTSSSGQPCTVAGQGNGTVDGATCQPIMLASNGTGTISNTNSSQGNFAVTYNLAILNYAGLKLAAGNYSGTLNAVAVAI